MGFFSKDIKTMDDLFVPTLRDIYYAESKIAKSQPEMIEKASDSRLEQGFKSHLSETQNHIARLQEVFRMHGVEIEGVDVRAGSRGGFRVPSGAPGTSERCARHR